LLGYFLRPCHGDLQWRIVKRTNFRTIRQRLPEQIYICTEKFKCEYSCGHYMPTLDVQLDEKATLFWRLRWKRWWRDVLASIADCGRRQCLLLCVEDLVQWIFARMLALLTDGDPGQSRGWQIWTFTTAPPCNSETESQITVLTVCSSVVKIRESNATTTTRVRTISHSSCPTLAHFLWPTRLD
jgi:hypothetical protein